MRRGRLTSCGLLAALTLSACGTSSGGRPPSAGDPAAVAPPTAVAFLTARVRPLGAERAMVEPALQKLFGSGADTAIQNTVNQLLGKIGASYGDNVQPWLGQRIGVVITGFEPGTPSGLSAADVAVIAPTTNPGAAQDFISRTVAAEPQETGGIIDHDLVLGGSAAYRAIVGISAGDSLAAVPAYREAIAKLGGDDLVTFYENTPLAEKADGGLTARYGSVGSAIRRAEPKLPADARLAYGLKVNPSSIRLDLVKLNYPTPKTSDPGANAGLLPSSAWLALDSGAGFTAQTENYLQLSFRLGLEAEARRISSGAPDPKVVTKVQQIAAIAQEVLAALGPLSLSVSGSAPGEIDAGLQVAPTDPAAAGVLLRTLRTLAVTDASLDVMSDGSASFSLELPRQERLVVSDHGHRVVATVGFPSAQAFLHPASTLADTPTYIEARATLPAGSTVPFFMSFAQLAQLIKVSDQDASASTLRALGELKYAIVGSRDGDTHIVVGLN